MRIEELEVVRVVKEVGLVKVIVEVVSVEVLNLMILLLIKSTIVVIAFFRLDYLVK